MLFYAAKCKYIFAFFFKKNYFTVMTEVKNLSFPHKYFKKGNYNDVLNYC